MIKSIKIVLLGAVVVATVLFMGGNADASNLTIRNDTSKRPAQQEVNDTIYDVFLAPIVIYSRRLDTRRYDRLVRNLKIVYPIAKYARKRLTQMEYDLGSIDNKRARERYIKQVEQDLKARYTPILKRMSMSQGKLLIKLIDRQTGNTSYELVKDFRGRLSAAFWQGMARIFGSNLKAQYDAQGEDRIIEQLIVMYENGQL